MLRPHDLVVAGKSLLTSASHVGRKGCVTSTRAVDHLGALLRCRFGTKCFFKPHAFQDFNAVATQVELESGCSKGGVAFHNSNIVIEL